MGKKTKVPPAPDLTPIAKAMQKQADQSFQLQNQQFEWAKSQDLKNQELNQTLVNDYLTRQGKLDIIADKDRARYEQTFLPLQDQLISQAQRYQDPAFQEAEAARQAAEVSRQYNLARGAAQDRLESFGIDPTQTRSAALDMSARTAEAAARAGAANAGRQGAIDRGINLMGGVLGYGNNLTGQALNAYGGAGQQGGAALSGSLQTTGSGASTMGTPMQWGSLGQQGLSSWGTMLNQNYQNQIAAYKAQNEQSSGWGQVLGLGLGIAGQMAMPGMQNMFSGFMGQPKRYAEGGPVPDEHQGIPITPQMSPSRGIATDDVPAQLNAGEFVVPKETVQWLGEKHFQKLIEKSKEEKAQAGAKPQAVPVADPRYPEAPMVPGPAPLPVQPAIAAPVRPPMRPMLPGPPQPSPPYEPWRRLPQGGGIRADLPAALPLG